MLLDGDLFVDELAVLIREHVAAVTKPLRDEIAELKAILAALPVPKDGRDGVDGKNGQDGLNGKDGSDGLNGKDGGDGLNGKDGKDGVSVTVDDVMPIVRELVSAIRVPKDGRDGVDGKDGRDGMDFDPAALDVALARAAEETHGFIAEQIEKSIASLPKPVDGKDGKDADPEFIRAEIAAQVALIPKPVDGKSVEPEAVAAMIADVVARLPKPQDGKDVDPEAVATMIRAEAERVVAEMPTPVNGTDGEPGKDGRDGHDGVQLDDIDMELRGDRTLVFSLMSGGQVVEKEVKLPWPLDRGTFRSGKTYEHGDCVTYAGNLWIATGDTSEAPGVGPAALWRMAVKRGKDGRSADAS